MRRRVVVTGMGCVTPLGTTVPELWANLKEGQFGVDYTTLFDASNFPTRISAEVRNWSLADVGEDPAAWEKRGRHTRFAIGAAKQAMDDSGVGRHRRPRPLRRLSRRRRRPAGLPQLQPHDGRRAQERRARSGHVHSGRTQAARPAARARARAEHAGRLRGHAVRRRGPELQLPHGLRRQQPGRRRGHRNHPPRRSRRHALRRRAQHDPPVRRHGLQPAHRAFRAKRRAAKGIAAVRPEPRRLHPRRRRRDGRARRLRARQEARRTDLRRNPRLRHHRRRVPHHRHAPRRPRRDHLHENGPPRRRPELRQTSTTSTPTARARR